MFPNGRIKEFNGHITNSWDFKIKYVEESTEKVVDSQFKNVLKKLVFASLDDKF